jgi:hypothetical protein
MCYRGREMIARYEIRRLTLDAEAALPIDEQTFRSIREAKDSLFRLFQIEEDYDILVGNYLDLEKTLLSLTAESVVRLPRDRTIADADRRRINRMFANLLTSARAFVDHTRINVSQLNGRSASRGLNLLPSEWDDDRPLAYRVLYSLRNHAQHFCSPIYGVSYQRRLARSENSKEDKLLTSVAPYLSVDELKSDPKLDKKLLEELELALGKEVLIAPLVREYVSSLSSVLVEVRRMLEIKKNNWLDTLDLWVSRYRAITESDSERSSIGVAAISLDERGTVSEEIHLLVEIRERLEFLQRANEHLANLHKVQIVS